MQQSPSRVTGWDSSHLTPVEAELSQAELAGYPFRPALYEERQPSEVRDSTYLKTISQAELNCPGTYLFLPIDRAPRSLLIFEIQGINQIPTYTSLIHVKVPSSITALKAGGPPPSLCHIC